MDDTIGNSTADGNDTSTDITSDGGGNDTTGGDGDISDNTGEGGDVTGETEAGPTTEPSARRNARRNTRRNRLLRYL